MKKILYFLFTACVILFTASCKNDDELTETTFDETKLAPLTVEIDNIVGSADLKLSTATYVDNNNESYDIDLFKYFVSNFKFTNANGKVYTVPQNTSYFLVDESIDSTKLLKFSIPEGKYTQVEFMIGVDSAKSRADISERTGVLDPAGTANGMYWSWNSGYIYLKMEGNSPSSTQANQVYKYHIGGYGYNGSFNNIKIVTLNLQPRGEAVVKTGNSPIVHLLADAAKVLNGSTNVSIQANSVVMASPYSVNIANNYASMFSHDHTHN